MLVAPRDYQAEARDAILATWGEEPWYKEGDRYRSCVLNIPTSSGKTIIAGLVCEAICKRGRFLYLADRDELCKQPKDKFTRLLGIGVDLEKAENKADRDSQVVIASVQTLSRMERLQRFKQDHFRYIFVDEAHRDPDRAKKITDYFSSAKVCGQTATAFRAKLKDLSNYYETVAYELGVFDLIEQGFIVPINVTTFPVDVDLSDVRQSQVLGEQDYDREELDTKMSPYYQRICELIQEHCAGRQILCFLPLIKSSQEFVEVARSNGINARHVDHKSPDRAEILLRFEQKKFQLISCSTLLSTGWDCPPCDTLLNLTPTRSALMWRQKVGRVLRVLPGVIDGLKHATERREAISASAKPNALILDLLYHADKFGLQNAADLIAANEEEREGIMEKLASGEELDLMAVGESVQAAREEELREQLERAARRKSEGLISGAQYAILMHDRDLLDYEPVSKWMAQPITDKQREYLLKQGIDPDTMKDRGHASLVTNKIWGRRRLGLCSYRTVAALEAAKVVGARHYSEDQAYARLRFDYPFPFGKPFRMRQTFRQVGYGYWQWLSRQDWVEERFPIVWKHLGQLGLAIKQPELSLDL